MKKKQYVKLKNLLNEIKNLKEEDAKSIEKIKK